MNNKLINLEKVKSLTTLSEEDIYSFVEDGKFPIPVEITSSQFAWVKKEVQEWIDQVVKNRKDVGDAF